MSQVLVLEKDRERKGKCDYLLNPPTRIHLIIHLSCKGREMEVCRCAELQRVVVELSQKQLSGSKIPFLPKRYTEAECEQR